MSLRSAEFFLRRLEQEWAMALSPEERELRDRFFKVLLGATLPLQPGPDPEVTLEALIDASQMLTEHLQRELDELRQEQVD
jgi:hypothetical protein